MSFFSVIIPTYNRAALIRETVESVLKQSFTDFEIIIIDDGSRDNTEAIINSFFSDNSRVRYFKKENEERGAARNFGLKNAIGEFAVFFDSDDLMKNNYLQTLYEVIKINPGVNFLAAKYNFLDVSGNERPAPIQKLKEGWYKRSFFLKGNILASNYCIRISGNEYRLFPPQKEMASMEDWLFILLNTEKDELFIRDKICLSMREHDERSMEDNQKVIGARKKATEWALEHLSLTAAEQKKLKAWSHYFCGIHQYLDHKRWAAVKENLAAVKLAGINRKFILVFLKSLIGRKLIRRLR